MDQNIPREQRTRLMTTIRSFEKEFGILPICKAFGIYRATYYRWKNVSKSNIIRKASHRVISDQEQKEILDTLHCGELRIKHPMKFMLFYWIDEYINARSDLSIEFWNLSMKSENIGINRDILTRINGY
jgi:hypothetical protein